LKVCCLLAFAALAAPLVAADPKPAAADAHDHTAGHEHGQGEDEESFLGTLELAGMKVFVSLSGDIEPGAEVHVDLAISEAKAAPRAIRVWIGNEAADSTGKNLAEKAAEDSFHGHAVVPDPLGAEDKLWVEVEDAARKKARGSLALKSGDDEHEGDEHEHGMEMLAVTLEPATADIDTLTTFALTLADDDSEALTGAELVEAHEHKLHVMAIDQSLTDYQHVHPVEVDAGRWSFEVTPKYAGEYKVYADATLAEENERALGIGSFTVAGEPQSIAKAVNSQTKVEDHTFTLRWKQRPVRAGEASVLEIGVTDAGGQPVTFEPLMGASAHIVAVSEDREAFAHVHPLEDVAPKPGTVAAEVEFEEPGFHRLFIQVSVGGRVLTAAFGVQVAPAAAGATGGSHAGHSH